MNTVYLKIFRFDPTRDFKPHYEVYEVPWCENLLLLQALKYVRDQCDPTLSFRDYSCGCCWCMSCLMTVDGKPRQACLTILEPHELVVVEPYWQYPVIKDLVVDFGIRVVSDEVNFRIRRGALIKKTYANKKHVTHGRKG